MTHEEIKILDIERKTSTFVVVFEVPGHHYGHDYPKRLTHSFPLSPHFLEKNENGDYEFEKILEKNYLDDPQSEEKREKVDSKLDKVRSEVKGKKKQRK